MQFPLNCTYPFYKICVYTAELFFFAHVLKAENTCLSRLTICRVRVFESTFRVRTLDAHSSLPRCKKSSANVSTFDILRQTQTVRVHSCLNGFVAISDVYYPLELSYGQLLDFTMNIVRS